MSLATWADRNGVAGLTAYGWFHFGPLRALARKVGRLILVDVPAGEAGLRPRTAVYAVVIEWPTAEQIPVDKVVVEVGSALNRHRRMFVGLLGDPLVHRIAVDHRDRFCRFGSEYVQAGLAAQGRELVVVHSAEVDDDLLRDMNEMLRSMCARLYGKRVADSRAGCALAAAALEDHGAA